MPRVESRPSLVLLLLPVTTARLVCAAWLIPLPPAHSASIPSVPVLMCEGEQVIAWLGAAGPDTIVAAVADGRRLTIHEVESETVAPMTSVDATEMGPVRGIALHPDGYWVSAAQGLWLAVLGDCALRYDTVNAHVWHSWGSFTDETSWRGGIIGGGALLGPGDGTAYAVLRPETEEAASYLMRGWDRGPGILGLLRLQGGELCFEAIFSARMDQAMALEHNTLWFVTPHLYIGGWGSGAATAKRVTRLPIADGDGWWRAPDLSPRVGVSGRPREPAALAFDPEGYPWVGLYDPEKQINTVYWWDREIGWIEDTQLPGLLGDERVASVIPITRERVYLCGADGTLLVGQGDAWGRVDYRQETGLRPVPGLGRAVRTGADLLVTDGRVLYRLQGAAQQDGRGEGRRAYALA